MKYVSFIVKTYVFMLIFVTNSVFCEGKVSRVGVRGVSQAAIRMVPAVKTSGTKETVAQTGNQEQKKSDQQTTDNKNKTNSDSNDNNDKNCKDRYNSCMDEFCLLEESDGYRCVCSNNIEASKSLIQQIESIQKEADKLFTEEVERVKLGAKAKFVFGKSEKSQKTDLLKWASQGVSGGDDTDELTADLNIGDVLYETAHKNCKAKLAGCGEGEMEKVLYERKIVQDCKTFAGYLKEQKSNAEQNKKIAEQAVRKAKLEMVDITNKYNRGECLLAYRSCIANKGGCGVKFESCMDDELLKRRSYACENVLDQCMAVKEYVLEDWKKESEMLMEEAEKYADSHKRETCFSKIQLCLEDGCSTSTNSACLSDVNVASGICPIIDECDELVPGIKNAINGKLGFLRIRFCQNDIDACLKDKCGVNFSKPECLGKNPNEILALCPQDIFPSCKGEQQYNVIVQSVLLQMDYQRMQGCINYFSEKLGKVCGTDMSCLPVDESIVTLEEIPTGNKLVEFRQSIKENAKKTVKDFFAKLEDDTTMDKCKDAKQPEGKNTLGQNVFNTAKMIAEINAINRSEREFDKKITELSKSNDADEAKKTCLETYKVEAGDVENNTMKIKSVNFEPSLRNCHVCRLQKICEEGGESKASGIMKGAAGGLAAGGAMGTQVSLGWGSAIGGLVGIAAGGAMGAASSGKKDFCQTVESCEDINM